MKSLDTLKECSEKLERDLKRLEKRTVRRLENAKMDLQECLAWEQTHHKAELLQSHLYRIKKGMQKVLIQDWEQENKELAVELDPAIEPHQQVARLYRKAKKLKLGIPHRIKQVEKLEKELATYQEFITQIQKVETQEAFEQLNKECSKYFYKKPSPKRIDQKEIKPYREYVTRAGLKIWVGKSAKDNDLLTFHYANGNDWWLHVSDFPGSHVVLKVLKGHEPDPESLQDAMLVALYHSKAKDNGCANICVTQCKYVSRLGQKNKGQVHISKHQVVYVEWDNNRWIQLKMEKNNE